MKDPETLEILQKRKTRWDKIVGALKITLGGYAFLVLTFLAVQGIIAQQQMASVLKKVEETTQQVRDSQLANQKTGTENHEKTRAYIKCLFTEVLTVPLRERTEVDFDTCTRQVDTKIKDDDTNSTAPQSNTAPTPTPSQSNVKPSEPTATAPPDPESTTKPTPNLLDSASNVVDGLLNVIGL